MNRAEVTTPLDEDVAWSDTGRRRRRRRGVVLALAATAVVGAVTAGTLADTAPTQTAADRTAPPATATVSRTTLSETEDFDGTLGYGATSALSGRIAGTLTTIPAVGAVVDRGQELYRVDDDPILLLIGTIPAYRDLASGVRGGDVRQLEENLHAMGYTGFTVDDAYTSATARAVSRWQHDLGLPRTGTVELGRVVFAPSAVRIAETVAAVGAEAGPGQPVLRTTGSAREVAVDLDVTDRDLLTHGGQVSVTLPDGTKVAGTVTEIGTVAQKGEDDATPGSGSTPSTLSVRIALDDPAAASAFDRAPVTVTLVAAERADVLAVPVAALLALPGGGYAVEVVDGAGSRLVPVETGVFADGLVEITGDGIAEGTIVGVPAR